MHTSSRIITNFPMRSRRRIGADGSTRATSQRSTTRAAYYAVPRFIEIVDELPKTGTQRIQYEALKQRGIGNSRDREQPGLKVARV